MHLRALVIASLAAAAAAQGSNSNVTDVTCGSTEYSAKQVEQAVTEGCRLHANDQTVGSNKYPHTFNNREDLTFSAEGPYQEFPIVKSGKFGKRATGRKKGGSGNNSKSENPPRLVLLPGTETFSRSKESPGADRVVFNPDLDGDCVFVGAMTHTGAEGNSFVECKEGSDGDDDSAGMAVTPAWYVAAGGMAAYWALGL